MEKRSKSKKIKVLEKNFTLKLIATRKEVKKMLDIKETYSLMFTDYPDIVNLVQMKQMLGGISDTLAYRMLREKKIKSKKVGREYKIPKVNVINYITTD